VSSGSQHSNSSSTTEPAQHKAIGFYMESRLS